VQSGKPSEVRLAFSVGRLWDCFRVIRQQPNTAPRKSTSDREALQHGPELYDGLGPAPRYQSRVFDVMFQMGNRWARSMMMRRHCRCDSLLVAGIVVLDCVASP
jgi:hypothetical protein